MGNKSGCSNTEQSSEVVVNDGVLASLRHEYEPEPLGSI